jgi:hypothetical protein
MWTLADEKMEPALVSRGILQIHIKELAS